MDPLPSTDAQLTTIAIDAIVAGDNDRADFDADDLQALVASIAHNGLMQPITVRQLAGGQYQIIAGERRWRAHRVLGRDTIQAIVVDADDRAARAMMAAENEARAQLKPLEQARSYDRMARLDGLSDAEIGKRVGRSAAFVAARRRLLRLDPALAPLVGTDTLQLSYAQALADSALDHNGQMIAWGRIQRAAVDGKLPAPAWCREAVIAPMVAAAQQAALFDGDFDAAYTQLAEVRAPEPAILPGEGEPPAGADVAAFWREQARRWQVQGRRAQAEMCRRAAHAADHARKAAEAAAIHTTADALAAMVAALRAAGVAEEVLATGIDASTSVWQAAQAA